MASNDSSRVQKDTSARKQPYTVLTPEARKARADKAYYEKMTHDLEVDLSNLQAAHEKELEVLNHAHDEAIEAVKLNVRAEVDHSWQDLQTQLTSANYGLKEKLEVSEKALNAHVEGDRHKLAMEIKEATKALMADQQKLEAELKRVPSRIAAAVGVKEVELKEEAAKLKKKTHRRLETEKSYNQYEIKNIKAVSNRTVDNLNARISQVCDENAEMEKRCSWARQEASMANDAKLAAMATATEARIKQRPDLREFEELKYKAATYWIRIHVQAPRLQKDRVYFHRETDTFQQFRRGIPMAKDETSFYSNETLIDKDSTKTLGELGIRNDDKITLAH